MMERTEASPTSVELLGIGEYAATRNQGQMLETLALGSCVAVILGDVQHRVRGLIHIALPDSTVDPKAAQKLPGRFADTGLPALIDAMRRAGAIGHPASWRCALFGGASIIGAAQLFNVGGRVTSAVEALIKELGSKVVRRELGGNISRSVRVRVGSGRVELRSPRREPVILESLV